MYLLQLGEQRNLHSLHMLLHTSYFVIDVPAADFRSDYSSEKLVKYHHVKIMGDCLEQ